MENEDLDDFVNKLKPLIEQMQQLGEQAYSIYKPQVEQIIESQSKDENSIERLMDYLLDHCGNQKVLTLFKRLCRYYWDINPRATADYIQAYREMWDEESLENEG